MEPTGTPAPAEGQISTPQGGQAATPSGVEGATPAEQQQVDTFTNLDPNSLPPELAGAYKSMQADYTRKMQEIAPYRGLGELQQIQRAMQFTQALESDPNFAVQVYGELGQMLQQGGFLQQEQPTPQAQPNEPNGFGDEFGEEDSPLAKEIQQIKEWASQIESDRQEQAFQAHLDRQEAAIRSQNPSYSDDDMRAIYQLAFSYGGDLIAAEQAYKENVNRIVSAYMQQKANVPAGLSTPPATPGAQEPHRFESLRDPELDKAVAAYLANLSAQGQ